ncbi:MAG TPA: S26 family signal peptidase [Patescibacteria group bacterium]|nr:S26 family signal peptidase [Patescibacteria group bacterium]
MFVLRRIEGLSMAPTLAPGQVVLAWNRPARVDMGDVVIIRHDGLEKIKRVHKIRGDELFVVGDNADVSTDSRHFGWIRRADVLGKVWWPARGH